MCAFYPLNICLGTVNLVKRSVDSVQTFVTCAQQNVTNSIWICARNVLKYVVPVLWSVEKSHNKELSL